jgi:hypothetical protein
MINDRTIKETDMRDHLTYATLAGHRRWRRYVVAAALILALVGILFGWVGWQRVLAWVERPESETALNSEQTWLVAASKPEKATPAPDAGNCPNDPEAWSLLDVYPGDNYKRIEPACVYDGLSKTVAWHMLERSGYTKTEAAELLDFHVLPWQPTKAIKGLTNTKGLRSIPLDIEWAPHSAYRTWSVDGEGQPTLAYSLRGCYRTRTIVGSSVEAWESYPVICVIAYDRAPGWTVSKLAEHHFSVDLTAAQTLRRLILLGYSGDMWLLLGEVSNQQKTLAETSEAGQEREQVTTRYGTVPWDAAWLDATFGLGISPLPDGWQTFGANPDAIQAIASELDDALQEFGVLP